MAENKCPIGGQAVIEGVLMRSKEKTAIVVRKPDDTFAVRCQENDSVTEEVAMLKMPVIRGFVKLLESMIVGIQALSYSANQALEEEEQIKPGELFLTLLVSLALGAGLFIVVPAFSIDLFHKFTSSVVAVNLLEGIVRIIIFLAYVLIISRMKDIQRVFQYHGAEHKVIHTLEAEEELTVANARKHTTLHPRCGTSFLLLVMIISVLVFSCLGKQDLLPRILSRLVLVPLIAGISYEFLRFSARHVNNPVLRILIQPGLWLQKLTTREPDDAQLEVAIRAVKEVL